MCVASFGQLMMSGMTRHNKKYVACFIRYTVVICIGSILPIGGILELIMGAEEFHLSTKSVSIQYLSLQPP